MKRGVKVMEMTHYYSICNSLGLLIRYNEEEDVIEYRYSDETEVQKTPLEYDEDSKPYFTIGEEIFYLDDFCRINLYLEDYCKINM